MRATAIVPVKRFSRAKQRLLERLDRRQRALIVGSMLDDVLRALARCEEVERVIVVSGEGRAERIAMRAAQQVKTPIEVLREPSDNGHSEAAVLGIVRAKALGARCSALLPGDCPLLDSSELDVALRSQPPAGVAVIPDRHGDGTNGLILSPADAMNPAFGPDSRRIHVERAGLMGLEVTVRELGSLGLDLDTPDDLVELMRVLEAEPARGPETARAFQRMRMGSADADEQ